MFLFQRLEGNDLLPYKEVVPRHSTPQMSALLLGHLLWRKQSHTWKIETNSIALHITKTIVLGRMNSAKEIFMILRAFLLHVILLRG